jgi:hypothetical protein
MFRDEQLAADVDGVRLTLNIKKTSRMLGSKKIEQELPNHTHFKDVGAGKTEFADIIVPTFDADAFEAFDTVFRMIEAIIAHSQQVD